MAFHPMSKLKLVNILGVLLQKDCITLKKGSVTVPQYVFPDVSPEGPEIIYYVTKLGKRNRVSGYWVSSNDNLWAPRIYCGMDVRL